MTASTTTTIRGVSIFSRQRKRKVDVFDIALSPEGIVIRRPGRADQHMSWERITQWDLAERPDCVVLTLRGGGSVTPLMVKGWTFDDLEAVMRQATEAVADPDAADPSAPKRGPYRRTQPTRRRHRPGRTVRAARAAASDVLPPAARRLEADRHRRAAGSARRRSDPGVAAECRHHQLGLPRPHRLTVLTLRRAPPRRDRPRSRRWGRRGSAPTGTRRRDGCRASPRAAGRTRTASWGRPASRAP